MINDLINSLGGIFGAALALMLAAGIAVGAMVGAVLVVAPLFAALSLPTRKKTGLELRDAQKEAAIAEPDSPVSASADNAVPADNPFSLASPLPSPVPSEASEADAGDPMTPPAAGRPDPDPIPSGLVSRPSSAAPVLNFPSAEMIDAARAKAHEEQKGSK